MVWRNATFAVLAAIVPVGCLIWVSYSVIGPALKKDLAASNQYVTHSEKTGVLKVKVPTIALSLGKDTSNLKPKDVEAMSFVYADERLKTWLENWAASHAPEAVPEDSELEDLKNVLDRSPLPAGALMTVGHGFNKQAGAPLVVSEIYHAAALKMDEDISRGSSNSIASSEDALAFIKNRQNIKDVLWPLIEKAENRKALDTMYVFYSDFLKYNTPKSRDSRMNAVAQSARIGLAGCCYLKGQYSAAMSLIEQSSREDLSGDRKASLEWIWGMVLFAQGKYGQAVPHIQILADDPSFDGSHGAREFLIEALCASGDSEGAKQWVESFAAQHPDEKALQVELQGILGSYHQHTKGSIASDDALSRIRG